MKKLIYLPFILIVMACSSNSDSGESNGSNNNETTEAASSIVADFLNDVDNLEDYEGNPIELFTKAVEGNYAEKTYLDKGNMKSLLEKAKGYSNCVIVVGNHTIVKISDLEDCKDSGSWGACIPMAEGFVKKGDLKYKEDYANNIIGIPDNQTRIAYLFN